MLKNGIYCFIIIVKLIFINNANISGKITGSKLENTSVELSGPVHRLVYPDKEGNFVFFNVPIGDYFLYVNDHKLEFDTYLLEIDDESIHAYHKNIKTMKGLKVKYPILIKPINQILFEEETPGVLSSILKSPYMIIIGITLLMFLCMKMVPQDQLQEQMKQMQKQNPLLSKGFQM